MNIAEYIQKLSAEFQSSGLCFGHGTDNPDDEAFYLVVAALDIDPEGTDWQSQELTRQQLQRLDKLARRRIDSREPVAYLTGKSWFCGLLFYSDKRALVPRSPIAELIANGFEPLLKETPEKILDLCAGGGCIGISCALQFADSQVVLADLSPEALSLAEQNIQLHGLSQRVSICRTDLFSDIEGRFGLIVSNPPYVSLPEYSKLPAEYHHEPKMGLLSDDDGLAIPLRILRQASDYLTDNGLLILEVGYSQQALQQRLSQIPLLWLDFEYGGGGVMAITREQLLQYADAIP